VSGEQERKLLLRLHPNSTGGDCRPDGADTEQQRGGQPEHQ
jgi:hypothetical protein